jgi:hypothetical protein
MDSGLLIFLMASEPRVMGSSSVDWTAIGTLALAAATFVLAALTARNVHKTSELVNATKQSAIAAERTIAEIQRDRELEYRPFIAWQLEDPQAPLTADAVNIGRGQAINCLCCATWLRDDLPALWTTDPFSLSPGSQRGVSCTFRGSR